MCCNTCQAKRAARIVAKPKGPRGTLPAGIPSALRCRQAERDCFLPGVGATGGVRAEAMAEIVTDTPQTIFYFFAERTPQHSLMHIAFSIAAAYPPAP